MQGHCVRRAAKGRRKGENPFSLFGIASEVRLSKYYWALTLRYCGAI